MASKKIQDSLVKAQAHEMKGRKQEAILAYKEACVTAHEALNAKAEEGVKRPDPLLVAAAALGWARVMLASNAWADLLGRYPDELLLHTLEGARRAKQRSRSLEGQLLLERSKALFAKPNKTADDLDAAVSLRYEALPLLQQGACEGLPWTMEQAKAVMEKVAVAGPLREEALTELLRRELGGGDEAMEGFSVLFNSWAVPGPTGEAEISLQDFLTKFVEMAKDLDRAVDRPPCAAPCDGGKVEGATEVEQELTTLVSRDGAGAWEAKAAELRMKGAAFEGITAESLEATWKKLGPRVKKLIDGDSTMACGHSCSTCPTKDTCQMHDAIKDIEDL